MLVLVDSSKVKFNSRGTHDDGVVVVLLVVVEDLLDGLDSGVLVALVGLAGRLLEPVKDSADERRDKGDLGLSASDSLAETEEKGEVAVDAVDLLEVLGGLDTLPGGGNLDQNSLLLDTDGLVESDELVGLEKSSEVQTVSMIGQGGQHQMWRWDSPWR